MTEYLCPFTPAQWNALIKSDAPMKKFRSVVEHNARIYLSALSIGEQVKTEQVVEALYPREIAEGSLSGDTARRRIYISLYKLASVGMEDCCVKGEVNGQFMGKPKRPWMWFSNGNLDVCCMCGQIVPQEEF